MAPPLLGRRTGPEDNSCGAYHRTNRLNLYKGQKRRVQIKESKRVSSCSQEVYVFILVWDPHYEKCHILYCESVDKQIHDRFMVPEAWHFFH